jgi:hypothetical protein
MPADALQVDHKLELVRQVLSSRTFAKAVRLSHFLEFVCRKTLDGHPEEINEQQIGIQVFGRSAAYSSTDDSIVRTQARLLRQRLEEYFEHECPTSAMVILIPRGGYVPIFEPRVARAPNASRDIASSQLIQPPEASTIPATTTGNSGGQNFAKARGLRSILLATAACATLAALCFPLWKLQRQPEAILWHSIFTAGRPIVIVPSDDGLVLLEELRRAPVTLDEYLSGNYPRQQPGGLNGSATANWLSSHQYTSTADLSLALRLDRLPEAASARVTTRYARALRLEDLKSSNIILIGGIGANPWVGLFSPELNFDVNYDWQTSQGYVINKNPQPGEQARYNENRGPGSLSSYGVLAYLPGLSGEGSTLLFEGSGMAGTEAAADFPFSGGHFNEFLKTLGYSQGETLPFFEVLLETRSLGGDAPQSHIVAWRRIPR